MSLYVLEEWSTTKLASDEPEFEGQIGNLTTPVGRETVLSCTVSNLGKYKVKLTYYVKSRLSVVR